MRREKRSVKKYVTRLGASKLKCDFSHVTNGSDYMKVGVATAKHVLKRHRKRFRAHDVPLPRSLDTRQNRRYVAEFLEGFADWSPGQARGVKEIRDACPTLEERTRKYWVAW